MTNTPTPDVPLTMHAHRCPRCGERWQDSACKHVALSLLCPACVAAESEMQRRGIDTHDLFDRQGGIGRWGNVSSS